MMILVFVKRVKVYKRAAMLGNTPKAPSPGLSPCIMLMLFSIMFTVVVCMVLKFVLAGV